MRASRACIALGVILAAANVWLEAGLGLEQPASLPAAPPIVYVAEIDCIIHPVATAYVRKTIADADAAPADLVIFLLRTPGGLVDSTRDINTAIIQAKTPVAVFVSPCRQPRRVRRVSHHHGCRCRRHVARHSHRRRTSCLR